MKGARVVVSGGIPVPIKSSLEGRAISSAWTTGSLSSGLERKVVQAKAFWSFVTM